jgi:hypothetical protein
VQKTTPPERIFETFNGKFKIEKNGEAKVGNAGYV